RSLVGSMKRLIWRIEYFILLFFRYVLLVLPLPLIPYIGALIGDVFHFFKIRHNVAYSNLVRTGLYDPSAIQRILRQTYRQFGKTFAELLVLDRYNDAHAKQFSFRLPEDWDWHNLRSSVLISAHFGNWELMGKALIAHGVPLAVVVRRQTNPYVDAWLFRHRTRCGMKVLYEDDIYGILRTLRSGHALALLSDQDFGHNKIPVNFFSQPCFAPAGPEMLARRTGCRAWICLGKRETSDQFVFSIDTISAPETSFSSHYTALIESAIRSAPEQWFWFHRRWKNNK
ncbi:MAG TPA: lysophospholipid acyltransferase family protein, partial [bacterium]|nr:lysophospholipid acyltransferase family protein [bacterium]